MELPEWAAAFPAIDEFEYIDFQVYAMTDAELEVMKMSTLPLTVLRLLITRWFAELEKLSWIRILADKGDEVLLNWREKKIFTNEKTLAQVTATFEENAQILAMLLGVRLRSENVQFTKRRYVREKKAFCLMKPFPSYWTKLLRFTKSMTAGILNLMKRLSLFVTWHAPFQCQLKKLKLHLNLQRNWIKSE